VKVTVFGRGTEELSTGDLCVQRFSFERVLSIILLKEKNISIVWS
jgi:hypothetical protein